jgi:bifunctional non-homologous end joining protein LigD
MSTATNEREVMLYCQDQNSDKVYGLQINAVDGGFNVYYCNGKRGATLKPKLINTKEPVNRVEADKIFDDKMKAKKKGKSGKSIYQESQDGGASLVISDNGGKNSGIEPQLLNEIDEVEALRLCHDPLWIAEQKHDGERRPLEIKDSTVSGTNRYGEYTSGMKQELFDKIDPSVNMILDTEDMGSYLMAFDILSFNGSDLRNFNTKKRKEILKDALVNQSGIKYNPIATTTEEKLALLEEMRINNHEGLVFKLLSSPYVGGRPNTGGTQLKFKFHHEASVLVKDINTQRSFQMEVIDENGDMFPLGNCTIPANQNIPKIGDVIEVVYRYANKSGKLNQPTFGKARTDLRKSECVKSQLVYKSKDALK